MKHTPGPWVIREELGRAKDDPNPPKFCFFSIVVDDEKYIPIGSSNAISTREQQEADVRLMAAAPEMLEALERLHVAIGQGDMIEISNAMAAALPIISKARGES